MLSRRNFINTTLAAGAALATQGNAKGTAMAQSKRMIVDAQAHLWKAESEDWKWVPGRKPQLPEPFTIEKLVPLMDEGGVDRAVIAGLVPAISIQWIKSCLGNRDCRDKPGNDKRRVRPAPAL